MNLPSAVTLREVAPRDGFQSLDPFIPTERKVDIIQRVVAAGVRFVEATSFVSPRAIPQLRDAADVMARVPHKEATYAALVPNLKGAQNAIAAGVDQLVVVISATEAHNQANVRRSVADSLSDLDAIFNAAASADVAVLGAAAVAFGCPYQGDVSNREVLRLAEAYHRRGAKAVILADTTGMASPLRVKQRVSEFKARFPDTGLVLHFHNNRGAAMANLLAALSAGAAVFDTALGGIGGCPNVPLAAGNLATADVVFMLEDMGISTGIDLEKIILAARRLEEIVGGTLPGQVMKSGPRDPLRAAGSCTRCLGKKERGW